MAVRERPIQTDGSIEKSAVFKFNVASGNGGAISSPSYATLKLPEDTFFGDNSLSDVSAPGRWQLRPWRNVKRRPRG